MQTATSSTSAESAPTSLLYCGGEYDSALQMYNLRARFYDPGIGRFTTRDVFAGINSDPQSLHKYAYCHCDPVNGLDPSGELTLGGLLIGVTLVAIAAWLFLRVFNSQSGRKVRMWVGGHAPTPAQREVISKALKLLKDRRLADQFLTDLDIMDINVVSERTAGRLVGVSVPGSRRISITDRWLNRASPDPNVDDVDTRIVAAQIFGEAQHAINAAWDTAETQQQLNKAIVKLELQDNPEVRRWRHGGH